MNKSEFSEETLRVHKKVANYIAMHVLEKPQENDKTLILCGETEEERNYLMQEVATRILEKEPEKKLIYTTGEIFSNGLREALINAKFSKAELLVDFRNKYRSVDILCIEKMQTIAESESCQEELIHTLNSRSFNGKKTIISLDKPDVKGMVDELRSCLENGKSIDVCRLKAQGGLLR